ncbi:DNA-directed RNA polymerases I and III subunit RPAC1 [Abrus precatorius]|uniref:DNA-directed RNA polymerases I and III subunit RPAC1 n=1 Tax=Abrus precatorius TaxID=3816 RepID=A0A8B8JZ63_ABRPR|nr:DNA-directed RNA polymerases I and III subunit RPAC1 [Abrus precatorius]XP_027336560.1 DNA-directed RNA polymerases I and III subunit RPAC1 [Abrus precatorius]
MSEEDESMSEFEEQEQEQSGGGGLDYIMSLESVPSKLPPHLELLRTRVLCNSDAPQHTDTIQYSGAYAALGVDNSLQLDNFSQNFKVEVKELKDDFLEFDMIGIDPAIANAFRRILIAEVPTMAIERVYIANNTSVIQDEVLAHRLGLIPIRADPRLFEYPENAGGDKNEKNTIVFKLHVRCQRGHPRITVKSDKLKWLPNGSELLCEDAKPNAGSKPKTFTSFTCSQDSLPEFSSDPLRPTDLDIILAKLGPGQEIELEAHAVKGIGKTHAKWSPVATAWYRMLPEVILLEDVEDELAEELTKKCPVKVFDIEDIGKGRRRARVAEPRKCTLCRECIRGGKEWEDRVSLRRVKDHFIFTIESTGALSPEVLFTEAVKILEDKCERVITELS